MAGGSDERAPLTRERVLRAAVALADEDGIGRLTMRELGHRLGVEAMSLYKHVAGKDEILDGIVDLVIGEIELPAPEDEWKDAMTRRAVSAREVLSRHPWAIGMMESRERMGPAALRYVDAVVGALRTAGFTVQMAGHAFLLLDSYIYGHVLQEHSFPGGTTDVDVDLVGHLAAGSPAVHYPHLAEFASEHIEGAGDYTDAFGFGLDLILEGLEHRLGR